MQRTVCSELGGNKMAFKAHLADSTRWRIYPLGDVVIKVVNKVLSQVSCLK